jgi:NADH:ubiquinone oxidoreductase subunit F (NADH-binding)
MRPEDMPGYTPDDWQYWSYLGGGVAVLKEHRRLVKEARLEAFKEARDIVHAASCGACRSYRENTSGIDALISQLEQT